ncbi:MAG: hypothetical protein OXI20_17260 [Rhodospirillales bacterium]|nr:hypothetical protein [Rhodospirillales bacterium]
MKTYQRGDSIPKQAQQMWLVLVAVATLRPKEEKYTGGWSRGLVTYGALATMMGKSPRAGVTLTRQLGIIGKFCEENDLPALNAIVVNRQGGQPGDDVVLSRTDDVEEEQEEVSKIDWFSIRPPTISQLRGVYERHPDLRYV